MATSPLTRCRTLPLPGSQVSMLIDGSERLRWHFGDSYPRPFFYPLVGPSGESLIRMGHPGAPNHDHHRGIWFAHHDVVDNDFWSEQGTARIRQLEWLCYEDGDDAARLAVKLGWFDGHDPGALVEQNVLVEVRPAADVGETLVEIQSTFIPLSQQLEFRQSNFGFLGVRVAKSISAYFGNGTITDSEGRQGEPAIFGKRATWMDYSGAVGKTTDSVTEGITYFDHPDNPGHPSHWHVREDGWMIASACMQASLITTQQSPLVLRYLLHAHGGNVAPQHADTLAAQFAVSRPLRLNKSRQKHTAFEIERLT